MTAPIITVRPARLINTVNVTGDEVPCLSWVPDDSVVVVGVGVTVTVGSCWLPIVARVVLMTALVVLEETALVVVDDVET